MSSIEEVRDRYSKQYLAIPGVTMVAIGAQTVNGQRVKVISIGVKTSAELSLIPATIEGYLVQAIVTGRIYA